MTRLLASVNSLDEAQAVQQTLQALQKPTPYIIDLKQPALGALGSLPIAEVQHIVSKLKQPVTISATIGDLPMQPPTLTAAVTAMASTGVNYIKIGFFPDGDWTACVNALSPLTSKLALVAVLFADQPFSMDFISTIANAGFTGVMLDTQNKQAGGLCTHLTIQQLSQFISLAKQHALLTGLAGSLTIADIEQLLPLKPDYLGFRGALCHQQQRTAQLDLSQLSIISRKLL